MALTLNLKLKPEIDDQFRYLILGPYTDKCDSDGTISPSQIRDRITFFKASNCPGAHDINSLNIIKLCSQKYDELDDKFIQNIEENRKCLERQLYQVCATNINGSCLPQNKVGPVPKYPCLTPQTINHTLQVVLRHILKRAYELLRIKEACKWLSNKIPFGKIKMNFIKAAYTIEVFLTNLYKYTNKIFILLQNGLLLSTNATISLLEVKNTMNSFGQALHPTHFYNPKLQRDLWQKKMEQQQIMQTIQFNENTIQRLDFSLEQSKKNYAEQVNKIIMEEKLKPILQKYEDQASFVDQYINYIERLASKNNPDVQVDLQLGFPQKGNTCFAASTNQLLVRSNYKDMDFLQFNKEYNFYYTAFVNWSKIAPFTQEDTNNYLTFLLSKLHKDKKSCESSIGSKYFIKSSSSLKCLEHDNSVIRITNTDCIPAINLNASMFKYKDIINAESFNTKETVEVKCDKCDKNTLHEKTTNYSFKNNNYLFINMTYNMILDKNMIDLESTLPFIITPTFKLDGYLFQVVGLIVHIGSTPTSGHYISIVKYNNWLLFDDASVHPFLVEDLEYVLKNGCLRKKDSKVVTILYEQVKL